MSARHDTWMPMYWGDYARDTGHLNNVEHGAYLMLIKHYWCTAKPLSDDDNELWRIACCDSKKEWIKIKRKVLKLFVSDDGTLRHKRIDVEICKTSAISTTKAEAGRKGAEKRWQKNGTPIASAIDVPLLKNAPLPLPLPKKDSVLRTAADAAPDARDILWSQGLPIIRSLIGQSDSQSRSFLGKLVKVSRDNCAETLRVVLEAQSLRPMDPQAWLLKAVVPSGERDLLDRPANAFGSTVGNGL